MFLSCCMPTPPLAWPNLLGSLLAREMIYKTFSWAILPFWAKRFISSSAHVCVHALYLRELSNTHLTQFHPCTRTCLVLWACVELGSVCPSPDPFSIHSIQSKVPGKLFRRIKYVLHSFPKLVVMTRKARFYHRISKVGKDTQDHPSPTVLPSPMALPKSCPSTHPLCIPWTFPGLVTPPPPYVSQC